MAPITPQFRNTALNLIIDLSEAFGRDPKDREWVESFPFPLIGNAAHECGGFKLMEEGSPTVKGSLGGISFFQWTGVSARNNRRAKFMANCRAKGLHPYSYEAAVDFMLVELRGTAKNVPGATIAADVQPNTPNPKTRLMARMVRFEVLYERAGVKHYPSRYAYALMAEQVWEEWIAAGCPKPGKYLMPKARFSADFDQEFGSGVGRVTARGGAVASPKPARAPFPVPQEAVPAALRVDSAGSVKAAELVPAMPKTANVGLEFLLPPVRRQAGKWPEQLLTVDEIKVVQTALREAGFVRVGTADGRWGDDTRAAITALQSAAGIETDGHWGAATRNALVSGTKANVSVARSLATVETVKAAGEPTVAAAAPVKTTGLWGAITTGSLGIGSFVVSNFQAAADTLAPAREFFAEMPGWVWFGLALAACLFMWWKARQVQAITVAQVQSGANTSFATPLELPKGVTLVESPAPWAGMAPTVPVETVEEEDQA